MARDEAEAPLAPANTAATWRADSVIARVAFVAAVQIPPKPVGAAFCAARHPALTESKCRSVGSGISLRVGSVCEQHSCDHEQQHLGHWVYADDDLAAQDDARCRVL